MIKLYILKGSVLLMILLINISTCSNSNTTADEDTKNTTKGSSIFDGFDFEKSNFTLVVVAQPRIKESNRLNYYTSDKKILEKLKREWIIGKESHGRCSPAYSLYLLNNDTICLNFQVTIDCSELFLNKKQYSFDSQGVFEPILNSFNLLNKHYAEFNSVVQRNSFVSKIDKKNTILNEIMNSNNINFKHIYRFQYIENTETNLLFGYKIDSLLIYLRKEIAKRYPKEEFVLECSYFNVNDDRTRYLYQIDLYCHENLFDRFNLFEPVHNFDTIGLKLIYFTLANSE